MLSCQLLIANLLGDMSFGRSLMFRSVSAVDHTERTKAESWQEKLANTVLTKESLRPQNVLQVLQEQNSIAPVTPFACTKQPHTLVFFSRSPCKQRPYRCRGSLSSQQGSSQAWLRRCLSIPTHSRGSSQSLNVYFNSQMSSPTLEI